jgi:hypothetical protein
MATVFDAAAGSMCVTATLVRTTAQEAARSDANKTNSNLVIVTSPSMNGSERLV